MRILAIVILLLPGWGRWPGAKIEREQQPPPVYRASDPLYGPRRYFSTPALTAYDVKLLARLGVVECRGMGWAVEDCTRSVVSTVLRRMAFYEETHGAYGLSDGTVYGTLDHNYQGLWQFPPWVTRGCEVVSEEACLDWVELQPFIDYVRGYLADGQAPCAGYLYYDSIPGGNSLCKVETPQGWIEFHQGWGWEPVAQ
jgi:hypothetical protein